MLNACYHNAYTHNWLIVSHDHRLCVHALSLGIGLSRWEMASSSCSLASDDDGDSVNLFSRSFEYFSECTRMSLRTPEITKLSWGSMLPQSEAAGWKPCSVKDTALIMHGYICSYMGYRGIGKTL